jgi:hypothetical protein
MSRLRRFGTAIGALTGLAVGLLLSLFLALITNLGRDGQLALVFLSGLAAVIGAGIGLERADQLIQTIRRLSTTVGPDPRRGPPICKRSRSRSGNASPAPALSANSLTNCPASGAPPPPAAGKTEKSADIPSMGRSSDGGTLLLATSLRP